MEETDEVSNPGRAARILVFLGAMFPPLSMIPAGVSQFFALYLGLQVLGGVAPLRVRPSAFAGALVVVLFALLMRVYDELKDVETDLRLGRAGDPKYRDRPIVTGAIRIEDLVFLRWTVTILLVAAAAVVGSPVVWGAFGLAFVAMWLSSRWFFWPAIQESLILAFVTHNPLTVLVQLFAASVLFEHVPVEPFRVPNLLLLLALWAPVAAWEISRKIRRPEDETDYETYSKALGWKVASLLPAALVAFSAGGLAWLMSGTSLPPWVSGVLAAAGALPIGACLLFRIAPTTRRAEALRPLVEVYAGAATIFVPCAMAVRFGVSWG